MHSSSPIPATSGARAEPHNGALAACGAEGQPLREGSSDQDAPGVRASSPIPPVMNRPAVLLLGALACIAIRASAQKSAPLPIDVALAQPRFPSYMPVALSPDGAWVAYTLQYPARRSAGDHSSGYLRYGVYGSVGSV